jgi:hypothetical protein
LTRPKTNRTKRPLLESLISFSLHSVGVSSFFEGGEGVERGGQQAAAAAAGARRSAARPPQSSSRRLPSSPRLFLFFLHRSQTRRRNFAAMSHRKFERKSNHTLTAIQRRARSRDPRQSRRGAEKKLSARSSRPPLAAARPIGARRARTGARETHRLLSASGRAALVARAGGRRAAKSRARGRRYCCCLSLRPLALARAAKHSRAPPPAPLPVD